MAEWLKAAVLKTASPATRRGGGGSVVTEHKGTCVRRPAKRGEAERASTSYSFVEDEKKLAEIEFSLK